MSNIDAPTAALLGALIAAVISITSLFINNYIQHSNNRDNILAKRAEIALTRRLQAFEDLASSIANVREGAIGIRIAMRKRDKEYLDNQISKLPGYMGALAESYGRNSIYFPSKIKESLTEGIELILEYSGRDTVANDEYLQLHHKCNETLALLTEEIGLYLGEQKPRM